MAEDIFEEAGDTHAWRPDEAPAVGEDVFDEAPLQPLRSETGASWLKRILVFGGTPFWGPAGRRRGMVVFPAPGTARCNRAEGASLCRPRGRHPKPN